MKEEECEKRGRDGKNEEEVKHVEMVDYEGGMRESVNEE